MCAKEIKKPKYEIVGDLERFDEADNAQARGELMPDTPLWQTYYSRHPELEARGRAWSQLPPMGSIAPAADGLVIDAMMQTIGHLSTDEILEGQPSKEKILLTASRYTTKVKSFAYLMGAGLVRIGPLNPAWVYQRVGRSHYPGKEIGPEINLPHQHAIVAAVPLNLGRLRNAPELGVNLETIRSYLKLTSIVVPLAKYIRSLGYAARAHTVVNYQILLTPVAIDAGLGEQGRHGLLINEDYGSALKIAAVTTDMPLDHDSPVDIGVEDFCRECHLCAQYCPSGSITLTGDKKIVRGVRKWKINDNSCYEYWRKVGTDCGICMAVCPWSRPRHFPHNLVVKNAQKYGWFRKAAIKMDSLGLRKRTAAPAGLEPQPQDWKRDLRPEHPFRDK